MRGSPFGFSNFSRGLNVLDSPYTLQEGESRDLLNVVSSPRGAIKKRFGSILFAGPSVATFPALAVTDSFIRANEKPLSNGGKWETFTYFDETKTSNTGEILENKWKITEGAEFESGALWNAKEENNPAVSVETSALLTGIGFFRLWVTKKAVKSEGYSLRVRKTEVAIDRTTGGNNETIAKSEALPQQEIGDIYGITVRGGIVTGWRKRAGTWTKVVEVADTTLTKGYGGISVGVSAPRLNNFSVGEANEGAAALESEGRSLGAVSVTASNVPYLIVSAGTKLVSINASGEVSVIKEGLTSGLRWSLIQSTESTEAGKFNRVIGGPVYLSNGMDAPLYWTGAAKNTEAKTWTSKAEGEFVEVPKAKYLVYLGNRVWAAGMTEDAGGGASAVRFSGFAVRAGEGEQTDPTNWPKGNVVWFEKDDGTAITGLGIVGPYVLVFKKHKMWAVYDLNEGENRRLSDSIGCIAPRSIVETPQGTFFLTPDQGVYMTNGTTVHEVARSVRPILQGIDKNEARAAKLDTLLNAAGGYINGHYYLSYTAKDGSAKTLDYDVILQSWWLHDIAANQWVIWEPTTGASSLYGIPPKAKGGVIKAFVDGVYQDSGANYTGANGLTAYWSSNWEPFFVYILRHRLNQPQVKKRIKALFVDGKGELITVAYQKFNSAGTTLKGTVDNADMAAPTSPVKLGTAELEVQAVRYYSLGVSRLWSLTFGNNSAEPFEVDSYAVDLVFRKS